MQLSEKLTAALASADEDYLIGLCNKGTVNRAKKDLAAGVAPEVQEDAGGGVRVKLGDTECMICAPLGESRCSCPSSAICRHRILAILWLKQQMQEEAAAQPALEEQPVFQELKEYPLEKLARQLGWKRLTSVIFHWESGDRPEIRQSSVVTVSMPWRPATVRLLEPLEHSTCTCHSKEFCLHKAEALLYWKLNCGLVKTEELSRFEPTDNEQMLEQVKGVSRAVQELLAAQLATGVSRMSPSVCETTERMAALCHTAGLPNLERALRALHGEYVSYFARSARYRDTALLQCLSQAFLLAAGLKRAEKNKIGAMAGTFRDEYELVGSLRLYLMGRRKFSGRSGYAGTIYYFWGINTKQYYTFTYVRPTFYEGGAQRGGEPILWGLPNQLWKLLGQMMDLHRAKATRTGNLSSSEQSRASLLGKRPLEAVLPPEEISTDFEPLLIGRSQPGKPERERLALLRPYRCITQEYDSVGQVFSLQLLDGSGRDIWLELRYQKELDQQFDRLRYVEQRLRNKPNIRSLFFGALYREGDKLKLHPIEIYLEDER